MRFDAVGSDIGSGRRAHFLEFRAHSIQDVFGNDGGFSRLQRIHPLAANERKLKKGISENKSNIMEDLDEDTKWWLGGILDGDGCVSLAGKGQFSLRVKQSEKGVILLQKLQGLLGGKIHKGERPKKETHRQTYVWGIDINAMVSEVCQNLEKYCHLKRPQMSLAANLVNSTLEQRHAQIERFKELKRIPHNPIDHAPLAYVGGIIDTDGGLRVHPVRVAVGQKYNALPDFLAREFGGSVTVENRPHGPFYIWQIYCTKAVEFLRRVEPYVYAKSDQVQIILDFADGKIDRKEAHTRLQKVQGNQGGIKEAYSPRSKKLTAERKRKYTFDMSHSLWSL